MTFVSRFERLPDSSIPLAFNLKYYDSTREMKLTLCPVISPNEKLFSAHNFKIFSFSSSSYVYSHK